MVPIFLLMICAGLSNINLHALDNLSEYQVPLISPTASVAAGAPAQAPHPLMNCKKLVTIPLESLPAGISYDSIKFVDDAMPGKLLLCIQMRVPPQELTHWCDIMNHEMHTVERTIDLVTGKREGDDIKLDLRKYTKQMRDELYFQGHKMTVDQKKAELILWEAAAQQPKQSYTDIVGSILYACCSWCNYPCRE